MTELGSELALTIIRVAVGLIVAGHGAQKLFGVFGGQGLDRWSAAVASMGFAQPRMFATLVAFTEFFGALMLAAGFLTPLGCAPPAVGTGVPVVQGAWAKGVWVTQGGLACTRLLL